ncbi:hypothetical protein E2C01_038264 [Portunus trituberculatus]|uniref:Uncharacterized protein n=1 Tax=Portunus trituberculatus TaxID=210409 RepID=A0A5B7FGD1_PORTR|nr:hypothetical protein [Portunus trituberculatus]
MLFSLDCGTVAGLGMCTGNQYTIIPENDESHAKKKDPSCNIPWHCFTLANSSNFSTSLNHICIFTFSDDGAAKLVSRHIAPPLYVSPVTRNVHVLMKTQCPLIILLERQL